MPDVLIIREVADHPAWQHVFDHAAEIRRAAGVKTPDFIDPEPLEADAP